MADYELQQKKLWHVKVAATGEIRKYVFKRDAVAAINYHFEHGKFPPKEADKCIR